MEGIAAKLVDALSMFWQALSEEERRLLLFGACYLGVVLVSAPAARRRQEREKRELASAVARELMEEARTHGRSSAA